MREAESLSQQEMPAILRSRALKPALIASLVVYFLYLLVSMVPARYAAWAVHSAAPMVWLTSVRGTLWNGSAGGGQVDLGEHAIALGEVKWSLNPWTLLTLKPCIKFEADSGAQMFSGRVCQSPFGSTKIQDLSVDLPLSLLSGVIPVQVEGQLSIQVIEGYLRGKRVDQLDARMSWENARVHNGETWWHMGAFGGQARENSNGGISVHLTDLGGGPLSVDLNTNFVIGSEVWTAEGTVKPDPSAPEQMRQGLQMFGEETEPGTFKIAWP